VYQSFRPDFIPLVELANLKRKDSTTMNPSGTRPESAYEEIPLAERKIGDVFPEPKSSPENGLLGTGRQDGPVEQAGEESCDSNGKVEDEKNEYPQGFKLALITVSVDSVIA
jgi:hypothetical protein